ncbi:hypothetical protein [Glaciecola petra]|uniref:Uncharacterized protein n=1 Tax=Glaciecola petra TaxID=3075602 RepID=A0ABU2ZQ00_9ALTE|nr:hypothetical protein [Aestuariibacter sp. P117]MDT0593542.1 hypothetical protein [Aestuariibacter sp. P117]
MMTEGELQAEKLEQYKNRIKKYAFPIAFISLLIVYFTINPSVYFCLAVFIGLLIVAIDEYWQAAKILNNEEKLSKLKAFTGRREAAVFINGGIVRELKHMLIVGALIAIWFYF